MILACVDGSGKSNIFLSWAIGLINIES